MTSRMVVGIGTVSVTLLLGATRMGSAQSIEQFTISRDDEFHESWPDVALAANGDLVVAYQESDSHGGGPVSTIVSRVSKDQGATWSEKTVVVSTRRSDEGWLNCSKLLRLQDDSILLVIDNILPHESPPGAHHFSNYSHAVIWLFRSRDNGRTWTGPEVTDIRGGIVPSIAQLHDGTLLLGVTVFEADNNWHQHQVLYRSTDSGRTWGGPVTVARHSVRQPNEGDFVELTTGEVVCYMRDDTRPVPNGLKAISRDGGQTWGPLYGSGPWIYSGRPDVGLLSTGEVFLTTRVEGAEPPGHYLGAYMEPQDAALEPTPLDAGPPSAARWALLDNDANPKPDWGYSGWVELPDGSVYVTQYITADAPAPRCFVRGYRLRPDFIRSMGRGDAE